MRVGIYFGRFLNLNLTAGGGATFHYSILNALSKIKTKHEFYIFSDDCETNLNKKDIKFIKLNRFYSDDKEGFLKRNLFRIPRKLKRLNLEKNYNTSLNKSVIDNKIEFMFFATPAYEHVSIPFIYTVWDLHHRRKSYFPEVSVTGWNFEKREERYKFVVPRAAYVFVGYEELKKEIIQFYGIPKERVKIFPFPTPEFALGGNEEPFDRLSPSLKLCRTCRVSGTELPKNYLFYPAQFWPHKNHIVILYALKILKEKYNLNFSVVFTGSDKGNLSYIKEKVIELNLQGKILFLDFVSTEELKLIYKKAFAMVYPSFLSPNNIPRLEAFALGCPVIMSNIPGAKEVSYDAAIYFDPASEENLAFKIKNLYDNLELKSRIIDNGKLKANSWNSQSYIDGVINIINQFEPVRRCWSSNIIYKHL